ncbi:MAG: metallophosphoesterase [Thomasclavelia sp.]|jgi:predicted MPP superfamily phosphohydrolase|nr:metallophosphoesterase [Thomasclavelia sp.]
MIGYLLLGGLGMIGSGIYIFHFLKRFLINILNIEFTGKVVVLVAIISILIVLPAYNFFRLYTIVLYHFVVISLVLELVNIFLKNNGLFRYIYQTGIISIVIASMFLGYGLYNMNHVSQTNKNFTSSKVNDLTILQITDLHMGTTMGTSKLKKLCNEMSQTKPDIVVLTGDIVDESTTKKEMEECFKLLGDIYNTKGVYYVFGNHDSATYSSNPPFNHQQVRETVESNKIICLEDEPYTVDNITIIGRKDPGFSDNIKRKTTKELMKDVNKNNYIIMLDHQPLDLDNNEKYGVNLQLSGHTHGGQIWPAGIFEHLVQGTLVYGTKDDGKFVAYTSSGIAGWGYPIKTGAKSEYVYITVK